MQIKHIFFDLDRTLWDFETNAYKTLSELYEEHALSKKGISDVDVFIDNYKMHNEHLWELYRDGKVEKDVLRSSRFKLTLQDFGIDDSRLASELGDQYIQKCPLKKNVFPFTYEVLDYLKEKYHLHIITNGFEEVQYVKLEQSKLLHYFEQIVTSEQVGVKKPNPEIFRHALVKAFCKPDESVMIGDDLPVDILAAKAMGMHQVYFNPEKIAHQESIDFEISCLSQLQELL
ncbi:MAG: noncanonical pyrimidine nucleotidase, YjjG family [Flavobacteriales bacterium]|nr:noncanonical pyrimidine nucleotidase, YjjG family [Flavobacteriales bacterium]|tara:strand:- start:3752 stop:4444 length:693 start_codon:yes stop_codon:yes gene_type:complete